jgi:hypothetical protein
MMIRTFLFGLLVASAIVVSACGRQVSPNPPNSGPGGLNPGFMSLKFDVAGPLNFQAYRYIFAFNTSGNGLTPWTNPSQNNWAAYTFAVEVGGVNGGTFAQAFQFLHQASNPHEVPAYLPLLTTPTQLNYVPNSNGTDTEFTVTFQPLIFNGVATPAPGTTAPPVKPIWQFNAFTVQPNINAVLIFQDSLGIGGPGDTSFVSPNLNINTQFDQVIYGLYSNTQMDPSADIVSVEIANNPATTPAP